MFGSLTLIFALCTDAFVANLAYGANRARVGWGKVALLNSMYSGCLGLALGLGNVISSVLPGDMIRIICFINPFLLGFIKFLGYSIKAYVNRHCCTRRSLSSPLSGLKVIIDIHGDPMAADADGSQSLGWKKTAFLTLAMSINSLVAEAMAVLLDIPVAAILTLSFAVGVYMMYGGLWLERRMASRFWCDLSWISGILLTVLALMKVLH